MAYAILERFQKRFWRALEFLNGRFLCGNFTGVVESFCGIVPLHVGIFLWVGGWIYRYKRPTMSGLSRALDRVSDLVLI